MSATAGQLDLGPAFSSGSPSRELSQWDTRPETARRLVAWAGVARGSRVLEPSAGRGNIVRALYAAGAVVTAGEIDTARAEMLEQCGAVCTVHRGDFLALAARLGPGDHFDLAVMNPPYEHGQDLEHVLAALSVAPRVVLLARLVFLEGQERLARLWAWHSLRRLKVFSERESFEGDVDGTPKSAMAAFDIARGPGASVLEWWS